MSVQMSIEQLQTHIEEALNELDALLSGWMVSPDVNDQKRAQILSYWIKTYTRMLRQEKNFNPASIPRLGRRQIVNVDFGFRVGSELGGLHYAVIMDKKNSQNANTATVVPLGSLKESFVPTRNKVKLSNGVYDSLQEKAQAQLNQSTAIINGFVSDSELLKLSEEKRAEEIGRRYTLAKSMLDGARASVEKMKKLKHGSVANISQLTTISKMRIKEPVTPKDALYGVKLSMEDMAAIEQGIIELYITKGNFKNS